MNLTAIEKMKTGEVVKGPSFACSDADCRGCLMTKHEFIMDSDFDRIIKVLEVQFVAQNDATGQADTSAQMLCDEMEEEINGENDKIRPSPFWDAGTGLKGKDAVRAARIAALYATTLNGLSSELKLPFGGYGLTAVCNDSTALVQQCLYGVTTIYPMTSVG
jgi:hypothetical protein